MEPFPSLKPSLSSGSSAESVLESALQTPLDVDSQDLLPSPLIGARPPTKMRSSHLEFLPKRLSSVLDSTSYRPPRPASTAIRHKRYASYDGSHQTHRIRRVTIESTSSTASSHNSLLRKTLLLVTPTTPSSRPHSSFPSPILPTPCTSLSSLASTSPNHPTPSLVAYAQPRSRTTSSRTSPFFVSSLKPCLAAEPTTALSPINTNSLAQFSPIPPAISSLLQFGVSASCSGTSIAAKRRHTVGGDRPQPRLGRNQGATRRASTQQYDDVLGGAPPKKATTPTAGLAYPPSISRALEPDCLANSAQATSGQTDSKHDDVSSNANGLNIPVTWDPRAVVSHRPIAATPRPAFPVEAKAQPTRPHEQKEEEEDALCPADVGKKHTHIDKGKGKAPAAATARIQGFARPLPRSSSLPAAPVSTSNRTTKCASAELGVAGRERSYDGSLPSLAAIESGSRLMRGKIVCATCGGAGPDFPRCGRCGEAWCSRECRIDANKKAGGKHRCSPSSRMQ